MAVLHAQRVGVAIAHLNQAAERVVDVAAVVGGIEQDRQRLRHPSRRERSADVAQLIRHVERPDEDPVRAVAREAE
jgi:hypothetical protein